MREISIHVHTYLYSVHTNLILLVSKAVEKNWLHKNHNGGTKVFCFLPCWEDVYSFSLIIQRISEMEDRILICYGLLFLMTVPSFLYCRIRFQ